jgi:hypothetical protein
LPHDRAVAASVRAAMRDSRFAWKGAVFDLALGVLINSRLG